MINRRAQQAPSRGGGANSWRTTHMPRSLPTTAMHLKSNGERGGSFLDGSRAEQVTHAAQTLAQHNSCQQPEPNARAVSARLALHGQRRPCRDGLEQLHPECCLARMVPRRKHPSPVARCKFCEGTKSPRPALSLRLDRPYTPSPPPGATSAGVVGRFNPIDYAQFFYGWRQ